MDPIGRRNPSGWRRHARIRTGSTSSVRFHLFDLVEQKHLVGKQYEGQSQNLRAMVHRMSDEVILQLTGEKGVHTTKIAYAMVQGEGKEIFVADFDGANVKQVTQNQSINLSPSGLPTERRSPSPPI